MTKNTDTKTLREGSKAATLLEMLQRKDGATLEEMTERTGWQTHSVRAAMTGLRKKGHAVEKRAVGNTTAWFIGAAA
jgi:transcription initiation factor IIE alpha subunit